MEKKATFKKAIKGDNRFGKAWEHTDLLYEYRGHEYIITKDNNGYMGTPLWKQHQEEQARIDKMIEDEGKPIPDWNPEAQEALEELFRFFETGEED